MRASRSVAVASLLVGPLTMAPSAGAAAPARPFRSGETLVYDVSWSSYLTAGSLTLSLSEAPESGTYRIVADAAPSPIVAKLYTLRYRSDSIVDSRTLLPRKRTFFSNEGGRERTRVTRFDQAAHRAEYEQRLGTVTRRQVAVPPYVQEPLSALYVMRSLALKGVGDKVTMPVLDGATTYSVQLSVAAREVVETGLGKIEAWKIAPRIVDREKGRAENRAMAVWYSTDERRLPLKVELELPVGSLKLVLREVRQGAGR